MIKSRFGKTVKIGRKRVRIEKITIAKWRELFKIVGALPMLLINAITAAPENRLAYLIVSIDESFDDIVSVISVLTGLDAEYIENEAASDELVTYITEMVKYNDFNSMLKNVGSVLPKN